jgi:hypothetical protein
LLVLAGVALAAAVLVPAALRDHAYRQKVARSRPIDWEHFERIKQGMSQAEVEAILGGPPGDFRTENVGYPPNVTCWEYGGARWGCWAGDQGIIAVGLDQHGEVARRGFGDADGFPPRSLAERVRDWLRRVWP